MEYLKAKPMTAGQLATMYGVSLRTLRKWLEPFTTDVNKCDASKIFTVKQIEAIYKHIGHP